MSFHRRWVFADRFIAAYATLASHDVDLCLIPEVDVDLYDDEYGILPYIRRCLERQRHCVVVTSEGISLPGLESDVDSEKRPQR